MRTRLAPAVGLSLGALAAIGPGAHAQLSPTLRAPTAVEGARAWLVDRGTPRARVIVEARVRHGTLSRRSVSTLQRHRTHHLGLIRLAAGSPAGGFLARASSRDELALTGARRSFSLRHRFVLPRRATLLDGELRLVVRADDRVLVGGLRAVRSRTRRVLVVPLRVTPPAPPPRPRCERLRQSAAYGTATPVSVVCTGHRVSFEIVRRPRHGRVRLLRSLSGRAELTYRPRRRFTGSDLFAIEARAAGAGTTRLSVPVDVDPFELRALGDSVTAGFGYLADGQPMTTGQFPSCIPPDQPNDQCSSNSSNGPGSTATQPNYLPDFGLAENVSWPAQFANQVGLTDAGQYENRAVSGATPADWASGFLSAQLDAIVADNPNLTVMTLGANPLLDTFLGGGGIGCGALTEETLFKDCVRSFIEQADLESNLQTVVTRLLTAPSGAIVVSQYHLAMPALALAVEYTPIQLEWMTQVLNSQVKDAVEGVAGFGKRVFQMAPPRFDAGLPPGSVLCSGTSFFVDGPSRQSQLSQSTLAGQPQFCGSTEYWIIDADDGIHPTTDGYAQFAASLSAVAKSNNLVPPLPSAEATVSYR